MTAQNILFNDGWQFCLCDIGTELSALPGRHWYDVELPHDWLINDTSKLYETGEGWYRRSLPCSAEQLSGRVLLNFDGVYMNSTLFVTREKTNCCSGSPTSRRIPAGTPAREFSATLC